MHEQKYKIGTPVFFYTLIDRIPGVIDYAEYIDGMWIYKILAGNLIANNVREDNIKVRTITDPPLYRREDTVRFSIGDESLEGVIRVVDAYGTFEQDEEPSYDIHVKGKGLYKHIRQSEVIEKFTCL